MYEKSTSSEEINAQIEKTVRTAECFSNQWSTERPSRPYSLSAESLTLDLRICLINTFSEGPDRLSFARHFIVRNEPWPDSSQVTSSGIRHSVLLEQVSSSGDSINDDSLRFVRMPLSDLGIEPTAADNLYSRSLYAVAYDDVVGSPQAILSA